jgi:hypothetical protein
MVLDITGACIELLILFEVIVMIMVIVGSDIEIIIILDAHGGG